MLKIKIFSSVIIFILTLLNSVCAQHLIQGKLTDQVSGETVPYASVGIPGTSAGTISNDNGEFSINVAALPIKIKIAHLSYQSIEIEVTDDKPLQIKLKAAANLLKEVKIGDPALTLIKLASEKAFKQRPIVHLAKAFSRQMSVEGDNPFCFTESFFDAQWQNWGLSKSKITNARYLEKQGGTAFTDLSFAASYSCGSVRNDILSTPICLKPDSLYKFKIKETLKTNGKEIVVINCQLKNVKKTSLAFTGDIYIDADTYDILKTDGTISKFGLYTHHIIASIKIKDLRIVSQFKLDDKGNTVLDYSTFAVKTSLKIGVVGVQTNNYTSKIIILGYDDNINPKALNKIQSNEKVKDMDLIKNAPYDVDFWKNNAVIRRTAAEDNAITYLEQQKNKQGNVN